jgi:hypothetical protein
VAGELVTELTAASDSMLQALDAFQRLTRA